MNGSTYTGYSEDWAYGFDHWILAADTDPNPTYYKDGAVHTKGIAQYIENSNKFEGKVLTISAKFTNGSLLVATTETISLTKSWASLCIKEDSSGNRVRITCKEGTLAAWVIGSCMWVKLEEGPIATRFVEPNFSDELEKCKRYYISDSNIMLQGYQGVSSVYAMYTVPRKMMLPGITVRIADKIGICRLLSDGTCGNMILTNVKIGVELMNNSGNAILTISADNMPSMTIGDAGFLFDIYSLIVDAEIYI